MGNTLTVVLVSRVERWIYPEGMTTAARTLFIGFVAAIPSMAVVSAKISIWRIPMPLPSAGTLFGDVCVVPLFETVLLMGTIVVARVCKIQRSYLPVVVGGLWGLSHVFSQGWTGLVIIWPFYCFSVGLVHLWSEGAWRALLSMATAHGIFNGLVYAAGWILMP